MAKANLLRECTQRQAGNPKKESAVRRSLKFLTDKWYSGYGTQYCQIILAVTEEGVTDKFTLLDVALAAQNVIETCVGPSKLSLGGGTIVGPKRRFAVYVNGIPDHEIGGPNENIDLRKLLEIVTPPLPAISNSSSSSSNQSLEKDGDLICFKPGYRGAWAVAPHLCSFAIEEIVRRDGYEEFFKEQTWWNGPATLAPDYHLTPDLWPAENEEGICEVTVTARDELTLDKFKLLDVAAGAQRVFDTCVTQKKPWGGSVDIGDKGFFVALNGRKPKGVGAGNSSVTGGVLALGTEEVQPLTID